MSFHWFQTVMWSKDFTYDYTKFKPVNYVGTLSISGKVTEGTNVHQARLVLVIHGSSVPIAETHTDVLGEYKFTGIPGGILYDVIAYDPEGVWEAKISTKRTPG